MKKAWCSWCIEECGHELFQKSFLSKNLHFCENCKNSTVTCSSCNKDMAKAGDLFDNALCACCYSLSSKKEKKEEPNFWKNLQEKRDIIFDSKRFTTNYAASQLVCFSLIHF